MHSNAARRPDLQADHLQQVLEILQHHVGDREVWAFGSRVGGRAKPHSDLDLAIRGESPVDFDTLANLKEEFSESSLPWKVDVVDWATASETFRRLIDADHIVLRKAGQGK